MIGRSVEKGMKFCCKGSQNIAIKFQSAHLRTFKIGCAK